MQNLTHTNIFETDDPDKEEIREYIISAIGEPENNPDFFCVEPTQNRQSIGIEQTRGMINWLQLKPYHAEQKIAVIREAEKLTLEAQNSLLKTLEEPPATSMIFLITKNHKALIKTIISRSQLIRLARTDQNKSREENLQNFAAELLTSPLKDQLKWIDDTSKIKNPVERKETIREFLSSVHEVIHAQNSKRVQLQNSKLLESANQALSRNISNRLILENIFFNFENAS